MTKPSSDTRHRIQQVARELFSQKGVQRTSLQDIADHLGITKPALYYHFRSREDLVRSILQPLLDEGQAFVTEQERRRGRSRATPQELLEGYFDFHYKHRADLVLVVSELTTLADLGLIDLMLSWRERLTRLVFGSRPTLEQSTRAVIAFGGLQDCCLQFPDAPHDRAQAGHRRRRDGGPRPLGRTHVRRQPVLRLHEDRDVRAEVLAGELKVAFGAVAAEIASGSSRPTARRCRPRSGSPARRRRRQRVVGSTRSTISEKNPFSSICRALRESTPVSTPARSPADTDSAAMSGSARIVRVRRVTGPWPQGRRGVRRSRAAESRGGVTPCATPMGRVDTGQDVTQHAKGTVVEYLPTGSFVKHDPMLPGRRAPQQWP